jgi:hypothetical protein
MFTILFSTVNIFYFKVCSLWTESVLAYKTLGTIFELKLNAAIDAGGRADEFNTDYQPPGCLSGMAHELT